MICFIYNRRSLLFRNYMLYNVDGYRFCLEKRSCILKIIGMFKYESMVIYL